MPTDAIRMLMKTLKCCDVELRSSDGTDDQRNRALVVGQMSTPQVNDLTNGLKVHGVASCVLDFPDTGGIVRGDVSQGERSGVGRGCFGDPSDGRGLEAEHVVFDAGGEVGVVKGRVDGKGLFAVLAGEFAEFVSTVLVSVDE